MRDFVSGAYTRLSEGDKLRAGELFEKAIALDPQFEAISLDSSDARAHALLGEVYIALSDFEHGLASFEQASRVPEG